MPYFHFFWTPENIEHCLAHGITTDEFEAIVGKPLFSDVSESSGRPIAGGKTPDGRYAYCVYEMLDELTVYPITAFFAEES